MSSKRSFFGPAAGLLSVAVLAAAAAQAPPSPEEPPPTAVAPDPGPGLYLGPATCGTPLCHGAVKPRGVYPVRQDEYHRWRTTDPHSGTWETLGAPRSVTIARNLGLSGAPAEVPLCQGCHAPAPPPERTRGPFPVEEGVTCERCHGPAGGWIGSHDEEGWSHADSLAAGMTELAEPAARAAVCLGCHQGQADLEVDHRLLAAGHPPLTFELDNYAAAVSHWRPTGAEGARAWAVGQVAALERELVLVARKAAAGQWPEPAFMICRDCHHEISEERWRRSDQPVTGFPRWSPVRYTVLRHLVAVFAPGEQMALEQALEQVAETVGLLGTPPSRVEEAARRAAAAAARVTPAVAAAVWDRRTLEDLLRRIAADGQALAATDFATARQVAFAVNTLASGLVATDPALLGTPLPQAVEALFEVTGEPRAYDHDRFALRLDGLAGALRRLP